MARRKLIAQIFLNLVFIMLVLITAGPFWMLVTSSLTDEAALVRNGYNFWPSQFSIYSYQYIFMSSGTIINAYKITILVTVLGTVASMLITIMLAYPLSRKELPGRMIVSFFIFFTMLFNGGLVPTYMMWTQTFHIKNTIWALIVPSLLMSAYNVILMRSFFTSNIPDSIIEAARIDGAREFRILFSIVIPLSKPMMATLAMMIGLRYWNDWTNSLYYVNKAYLFSVQAILNNMLTNIQFLSEHPDLGNSSAMQSVPSVGIRMAIAVVGAIPILLIYPFFQKYFVKGIVVGGIKG